MEKAASWVLAAGVGALVLGGCTSDTKEARIVLARFEHVFQVCKEETEKQKVEPGKHDCSHISSAALDRALRETGIDEDEMVKMRDAWLEQHGYGAVYLSPERRKL